MGVPSHLVSCWMSPLPKRMKAKLLLTLELNQHGQCVTKFNLIIRSYSHFHFHCFGTKQRTQCFFLLNNKRIQSEEQGEQGVLVSLTKKPPMVVCYVISWVICYQKKQKCYSQFKSTEGILVNITAQIWINCN